MGIFEVMILIVFGSLCLFAVLVALMMLIMSNWLLNKFMKKSYEVSMNCLKQYGFDDED